MGEEGTNFRLTQIEKDNAKAETVIEKQGTDITGIKIDLAIIKKDTKSILDTYIVIRNACVTLLIINIAGILWVINK